MTNLNNPRQLRALKTDEMEITNFTKLFTVKTKNNEYLVELFQNGHYRCGCPDFYNRKIECKHILFSKQVGDTVRLDCPYGTACTRKNLFHFQEFKHNNNIQQQALQQQSQQTASTQQIINNHN
jgi:hypothetical protein